MADSHRTPRHDDDGLMTHIDYWLGLMRRLAAEVRSLSEDPSVSASEQTMYCGTCGYVLVTSGSAHHYCPNGCGMLRAHGGTQENG